MLKGIDFINEPGDHTKTHHYGNKLHTPFYFTSNKLMSKKSTEFGGIEAPAPLHP